MTWQELGALAYGAVAGLAGIVALRQRGGPRAYVAAIIGGLIVLGLVFVTRDGVSDSSRGALAAVLIGALVAAAVVSALLVVLFQGGVRRHHG